MNTRTTRLNCDCDPAKPCPHTATEDLARALRILRGLTDRAKGAEAAQLALAIETLDRIDIPARILRGEYDAAARERVQDIETAEKDAKYGARADDEWPCDRRDCGHDSGQHEDFGACDVTGCQCQKYVPQEA